MKLNFGKIIRIVLFTFFFCFIFSSKSFAGEAAGVGEDCQTVDDCSEYGEGDWRCISNVCSLANVVSYSTSPWYAPTVSQVHDNKIKEDPNADQYTSFTSSSMAVAWADLVYGNETIDENGEAVIQNGALQNLAGLIGGMTAHPPAKTIEYIADVANDAGFVDSAYAQGTGWLALDPVLDVWKAFRNIAYFAFVILFVVIGFMIMFRKKIGGQTVVTIQAAIPQIIVTMLLITFSYAIASLVIDSIYLLIYLIIGIFNTFGLITDVSAAKEMILGKSLFANGIKMAFGTWGDGDAGLARSASQAVGDAVQNMLSKDMLGGGKGLGWLSSVLVYLIFAFAIVIAIFKLFFKLLLAYISIIFSVIFSPIMLLFNAMPGSQSFGKWLKGIFANALLFPATAIIILVSAVLTSADTYGVNQNIGYSKQTSYASVGLPFVMGGMSTDAIQALIGIGMLMVMPQLLEMIQKAMGVEGGIAGMAEGIMGGLGAGAKSAMYLPKRAYQSNRAAQMGIDNQILSMQAHDPSMTRDEAIRNLIDQGRGQSETDIKRGLAWDHFIGKKKN